MANKEFKVGETFQCGLVKLKVAKIPDAHFLCKGCYIGQITRECGVFKDFVGECIGEERQDKTDVIFAKVEE